MSDFEFTLNNPLTDEQWDMITDVNLERTNSVQFQTKSGNVVEFVKVIRCKDCTWADWYESMSGECLCYCMKHGSSGHDEDCYCSYAEREENNE